MTEKKSLHNTTLVKNLGLFTLSAVIKEYVSTIKYVLKQDKNFVQFYYSNCQSV